MSIVLIGGHDRMGRRYKEMGKEKGHRIKVYTQMPARFAKSIGNPDAILFFTNTVSHKMVKVATSEAKKLKIPVFKSHSSSADSLKNAIKILEDSLEGKKV